MAHKKLGDYPFIAKPVDFDELLDCIEENSPSGGVTAGPGHQADFR